MTAVRPALLKDDIEATARIGQLNETASVRL